MAAGLAPGWMLGITPTGLVAIGPEVEVEIRGAPDRARALAHRLAHWTAGPPGAAGSPAAGPPDTGSPDAGPRGTVPSAAGPPDDDPDVQAVAAQLQRLGAFGHPTPTPDGCSLADALLADRAGRPPGGVVWTADEALLLPRNLPAAERSRALRAFVAGLRPEGRRIAYGVVADGGGAVHGDVPDAERLRARIAATGGAGPAVAVVELADDGVRWTVGPEGIERIGAGAAHRLGPITWLSAPVPVADDDPGLLVCLAEVAAPRTAAGPDRLVQGVGTAAHAALVARAEGAERYAGHDASRASLRRERRVDLPGALDPRELFRRASSGGAAPSDASDASDATGATGAADAAENASTTAATAATEDAAADRARLWARVHARDGAPRWVPAETVYLTPGDAVDPSALLPWSSSGMAAHATVAAARERALAELVERDAFVWTWLQRVSRERVTGGIPADADGRRRTLARHGWATTWVNLSLDSDPVILCGLVHERRGLVLGAACAPDPASALERATVEALVLALRFPDDGTPPPAPHEVRTPRDHLRLHLDPARRADHGFLLAGADEIDLRDVADRRGEDLGERLEALGHPPLVADLTAPSTAPFSVVRALAPGLLPLTFGWGNDPAGLPRARGPVATRDGRRLGRRLAADALAGRLPHPFP